ncbi:MAG: hypothetical protein CM1200mP9_07930 [Gammaproteobacteria bacterium]|nr:MAG: hypothetical protein CM1200mP9_07930 [Gammaproteobacteria bacterium]
MLMYEGVPATQFREPFVPDVRRIQFHVAINLVSPDTRNNFFETTVVTGPIVKDLDMPALRFCPARYMRKRSPENKAASSPPVPARISRKMFEASLGSCGSRSSWIDLPICSISRLTRRYRLQLGLVFHDRYQRTTLLRPQDPRLTSGTVDIEK